MNRGPLFWFPVMSLLILGCNQSREKALLKLGLDPEMARALADPDTTSLSIHCQEAGLLPTRDAVETLEKAVFTASQPSYFATREQLRPDVERLSRCLRDSFKFDGEWSEYLAWSNRTLEEANQLEQTTNELGEVNRDTLHTFHDKLERYKEMEKKFRSSKSVPGVVLALEAQAKMYNALKDTNSAIACYRKALAEREAAGRHTMTMSLTTTLGFILGQQGKTDSMLTCYNRSLRMSEESRDPVGTSRAYKFLASYYQHVGQFGTAYELLQRAIQRCREFKGGNDEIYALFSLMDLQARLGIWESTIQLLERSDLLLEEAKSKPNPNGPVFRAINLEATELRIGLIRGRLLAASGQEEKADSLFRSMRVIARQAINLEAFASLLYARSSALLNFGKPDQAAILAREGLAYADSAHLDLEAVRLNLLLADAACQLGKTDECKQALQRFRDLIGENETENRNYWVVHDRILINLSLASGDTLQAERQALDAMVRLERLLGPLDQSVQACLFLDDCRPLRESIHEILSNNPEAGYGFEMAWRGLYRAMGSKSSPNSSFFTKNKRSLSQRCASLGRITQGRVGNFGSIHLVYFAGSEGVTRWVASTTGVRRELLPISPSKMREEVETVTRGLASHENGAANKRAVLDALTNLAVLLPPRRGDADPEPSFLVSPDLYLSNLPFEAINLDGKFGYRPLIESHDVAYVRQAQSSHPVHAGPGSGIVLFSPRYPPVLIRRYPSLTSLPNAAQEAAMVTASFPHSTTLSDTAATKRALKGAWGRPAFIYVVSHFIQDTGSPYISFLPLAAADSAGPADALLEYSDIRKADLSMCGLVVLSGCRTGAVYANEKTSAPSLGDAFLDAGATAVVDTRWRVQDDEAYEVARAFITGWSHGNSSIHALNEAQREVWRRSGKELSAAWTAYGVTLSEIPSPPNHRNHVSKN